jgi:hypothetical protein
MDLKPAQLWPSLAHIRSEFYPDLLTAKSIEGVRIGVGRPSKASPFQQLSPLRELARRREAVIAKNFSSTWLIGRLVLVKVQASARPVLLTRSLGADLWSGFMVAPECDWAAAFDVLLEPRDEPFDPLCGMVQCWNPVTIRSTTHKSAPVLGELSPARLNLMLTAANDGDRSDCGLHSGNPGEIALRSLSNEQTVLTGTAIGEVDIRREFQALYRQLAKAISV